MCVFVLDKSLKVFRAISFAVALLASAQLARSEVDAENAKLPRLASPAYGALKVSSFFIEAPAEVLRLADPPDQRPVWRMRGRDPRAALDELAGAGLTDAEISALSAPGAFAVEVDRVSFLTPLVVLMGLAPPVRDAVHALLARNGLNPLYHEPLVIHGDLDAWLRGSALSARQQSVFRELIWRRQGALVFSDLPALSLVADSAVEAEEALRIMTRVRALRVTVIPPVKAARDAFQAYWSAEGLNSAAGPMLNSAAESSSDEGIDLALLLPALARERLYTFPALQDGVAGRLPDCNWTSLNFFSFRPKPYYLDGRSSYLELTQQYDQIPGVERLGDLIAFVSADGNVHHTCVHIAEDIVFTKNGQTLFAPWILQRLADVNAIYGGPGRSLRFFRLRPVRS